jgi:hypothetical protein
LNCLFFDVGKLLRDATRVLRHLVECLGPTYSCRRSAALWSVAGRWELVQTALNLLHQCVARGLGDAAQPNRAGYRGQKMEETTEMAAT